MFPPTTDYNQQLLAYLQAWQQLLQQWTAMMLGAPFPTSPFAMPGAPTGGPFTPPTAPFMPPTAPFMPPTTSTPPMAPAPADYTQQLFGYLQAWRQYLEQMTGARPGSPQTSTAQPANDGPKAGSPQSPDGFPPPGNGTGSKTVPGSDVGKGSNPNWPLVDLPPGNYNVSQISASGIDLTSPFNRGPEEPQVLNPPDYAFGYESSGPRGSRVTAGPASSSATPGASPHTSEAPAQHRTGSPFLSAMDRVEPAVSPQFAPRSLFSRPGAQQTASAREARETPSP